MSESVDSGDYEIKSGVPIPPAKAFQMDSYKTKYPFDRLEVGQCFEYELSVIEAGRLRSRAAAYGKRSGKRFAVRSSNGKGCCWRVE